MKAFALALLFLVAFAAIGCGADKTVQVGEPGQKGVYRTNIDKASNVAGEATSRIKQGEKDVYGG